MKNPRVAARVALVLAGCFVALLIAEIALRVAAVVGDPGSMEPETELTRSERAEASEPHATSLRGLVRPSRHPDLVYELKPGLDVVFMGQRVCTNSVATRGPEPSIVKSAGTMRIVGLGDSVMFGWGVREEDTYLKILEGRLAAEFGVTVETLNFSVPGYNTAMEVAALRHRALVFEPDLIILHFIHNDFDLPRFLLLPEDPWRLDRLWLMDLVRRPDGRGSRHSGRWLEPRSVDGLGESERNRVHQRYRHLVGERAFLGAVAELGELAAARDIPVLFMVLQRHGEPHDRVVAAAEDAGFIVVEAGRYLTDHAARRGVEPTREAWADAFWISRRDQHPNALGHSLRAQALLDTFEEHQLMGTPGADE